MSSLFGNLPPLQRQAEEPPSKRARPDGAGAGPASASSDVARTGVTEDTSRQEPAAVPSPSHVQGGSQEGGDAGSPAPAPPKVDGAALAIVRIGNHISQPTKFAKASRLLRQLMEQVRREGKGVGVVVRGGTSRTRSAWAPCFFAPDGNRNALAMPVLPALAFFSIVAAMSPSCRGRMS